VTSSDPLLGQKIGPYVISRHLASGGMGMIYLGEHPEIGSKVAIKVLLPRYVKSATIVQRFFDEARAVNRIGHPGIVQVMDYDELPEVGVYLIMEYLEGKTLQELGEAKGGFSPGETVEIIRQAADALQASHDAGIIHRDLKPANIFLVPDATRPGGQQVKILDFGIAKIVEHQYDSESMTKTGTVVGSPLFMSPEQCLDSKHVDHCSDIYSLGAIAYVMLTGRVPFDAPSVGKLVLMHRTIRPAAIREFTLKVPEALDLAVRKALETELEDRFQSMREFAEAMEEAVSGTAEAGHDGGSPDPEAALAFKNTAPREAVKSGDPTTEISRRPPSRVWMAGGALVAAAVILVALYALVIRPADPAAAEQEGASISGNPSNPAAAAPAAKGESAGTLAPPAPAVAPKQGLPEQQGTVLITFDLFPTSALIKVDDRPVIENPLAFSRSEDPHRLRIEAEGYEAQEHEFVADRNKTLRIVLKKSPLGRQGKTAARPAKPRKGSIRKPGDVSMGAPPRPPPAKVKQKGPKPKKDSPYFNDL